MHLLLPGVTPVVMWSCCRRLKLEVSLAEKKLVDDQTSLSRLVAVTLFVCSAN